MTNTERPSQPLAYKPAGYIRLASYSSLGYFWKLLTGAKRAGQEIHLIRGDHPNTTRRRISGYAIAQAAPLLDKAHLRRDLDDGFVVHPVLTALLANDHQPLDDAINQHYLLHLHFVIALTTQRDFTVKPEFKFKPIARQSSDLPHNLALKARSFRRDELNVLLLRACGIGC